jgi:hypothetical protein
MRLRALVVAGEAPLTLCKRQRLCSKVDPGLIERYPHRSLEEYEHQGRAILIGHTRAAVMLEDRAFPQSGQDFVDAVLEAHRITFEEGDPHIAGRLREQPVWFGRGGHGPNHREGAPHDQVLGLLLAFELPPPPTTVYEAGLWGADFLRRFFSIHPFLDGNGRVGRLLMVRAIEDSGDLVVYGDHNRNSRRYLCALEYAHRHAGAESRKNCLRYLSKYIADLVTTTAQLDDLGEWTDFEDLGLDFDEELRARDFPNDDDHDDHHDEFVDDEEDD